MARKLSLSPSVTKLFPLSTQPFYVQTENWKSWSFASEGMAFPLLFVISSVSALSAGGPSLPLSAYYWVQTDDLIRIEALLVSSHLSVAVSHVAAFIKDIFHSVDFYVNSHFPAPTVLLQISALSPTSQHTLYPASSQNQQTCILSFD